MIPIRWRLTIFHAITTLLIAVGLVAGVFLVLIRAEESEVGDRAEARAVDAAQIVAVQGTLAQTDLTRLSANDVQIVVRDERGRPILEPGSSLPERRDSAAPVWRQALQSGVPAGETIEVVPTPFDELNPDGSLYTRVYIHAVPVEPADSAARVVEARIPYDSIGSSLLPVAPLAGLAVVAVLLTIGGSYLLARRAFAPVKAIAQSTREITESNLSQRLPVRSRRDELGQLATTFNDLLARLETSFEQKEEVLAHQRRFVADASHELRTPLTSILGYARLLREWGLENPETARESVAAIEHQAARMYKLVEDLLNLARGDEADALDLYHHDLRDIAARVTETGRTVANGRITVGYDPQPERVPALVDGDLIYQAAAILLDNAVKYTPHGGRVTVMARTTEHGPELQVTDTGIGIAADHLPHLFERFYQVDKARSTGGAGLGLAIAQQIVELHGGTIDVCSVPGQGSSFVIRLPRPDVTKGRA